MTPADRIALPESMRQLGARTAEIAMEVHQLSHRLHSTKLETLGLQAAVRGHCRELRTQGLQVQCLIENVPGGLAHDVALCVFRVVQEGLNNVVKHSGASEARVTLAGTEDGLVLTITDSGRGFAETAARDLAGVGLASMRERVHLAGGTFTLSSEPGQGVTIVVRVPIIGDGRAGRGASPAAGRLRRGSRCRAGAAAQRGRRGLAEHGLVGAGEAAELEEAVVGGDGRDGAAGAVGQAERAPHLRETGLHLAALGAHAADGVERVAEAALADAGNPAEYGNRNRFADATSHERFDALDNLAPGRERLGAMGGGC